MLNRVFVSARRSLRRRMPGGNLPPLAVVLLMLGLALGPTGTGRGQDSDPVVTPINDRFYMIGWEDPADSTVLLYVGEDAALLVDTHWSATSPALQAAIAEITDLPLRYVINTHWHPDHTDANADLGSNGAVVIAHDQVRTRMAAGQLIELFGAHVAPYPEEALPDVTFDSQIKLYLGGQEILVIHEAPAHTDGDAVVFFPEANVIHMGDVFAPIGYPFFDLSSGGGVSGYVALLDRALEVIDESTAVVPGHGRLSTTADLRQYRDMLVTVIERVQGEIDAGKSLREIQAGGLTTEFDALYDRPPLNSTVFVATLYQLLTEQASGTASSSEPAGGTEAIIRAFYEAANAGDWETALSYWADDGTFTVMGELMQGKEQIGAFMQAAAEEHGFVEVTQLEAVGDSATWVSLPKAGGEFHLSATLRDGKIQSMTIE